MMETLTKIYMDVLFDKIKDEDMTNYLDLNGISLEDYNNGIELMSYLSEDNRAALREKIQRALTVKPKEKPADINVQIEPHVLEETKESQKEIHVQKLDTILTMLMSGVTYLDGTTRKFNLLDFQFILNLDPDEALSLAKEVYATNEDAYDKIAKILWPITNKKQNKRSRERLKQMGYQYKKDDNYLTLDDESKDQIIDFLELHDISLYEDIYSYALRAFVKNQLFSIQADLGIEVAEEKNKTV